jgi:hypothetical protein
MLTIAHHQIRLSQVINVISKYFEQAAPGLLQGHAHRCRHPRKMLLGCCHLSTGEHLQK